MNDTTRKQRTVMMTDAEWQDLKESSAVVGMRPSAFIVHRLATTSVATSERCTHRRHAGPHGALARRSRGDRASAPRRGSGDLEGHQRARRCPPCPGTEAGPMTEDRARQRNYYCTAKQQAIITKRAKKAGMSRSAFMVACALHDEPAGEDLMLARREREAPPRSTHGLGRGDDAPDGASAGSRHVRHRRARVAVPPQGAGERSLKHRPKTAGQVLALMHGRELGEDQGPGIAGRHDELRLPRAGRPSGRSRTTPRGRGASHGTAADDHAEAARRVIAHLPPVPA